jgi:nitrite reductase/ring-hydroxylating ferredoxin subunit
MDPVKIDADTVAQATLRLVSSGDAICPAAALTECGAGVRFAVVSATGVQPAFAIRYRGVVYAYLNRCAHRAVELDWTEGDFFSADKEFLVCATHGARYHPVTGACAGGRCNGLGLTALAVGVTGQDVVFLSNS